MHFEIAHTTEYRYDAPVLLAPQVLRMRPREDGTQRLHVFRLDVEPAPSRVNTQVEPEGNTSLLTAFSAPLTHFRVKAYSKVETHRANPFDYLIVELAAMQVPVRYEARITQVLGPELAAIPAPSVEAFAEECARDAGRDTHRFLTVLNGRLWETIRVGVRLHGDPLHPEECLRLREGACRDVAMVFVAAARHMGIAARFVSGYQMTEPNELERHLHAWAEVYLPGGGWRGFDPTHGIAVDERYVPVAASALSALAAPVEGGYAPRHVGSRMKVELDIRSSCPLPTGVETDGFILSSEPSASGSAFAAARPSLQGPQRG